MAKETSQIATPPPGAEPHNRPNAGQEGAQQQAGQQSNVQSQDARASAPPVDARNAGARSAPAEVAHPSQPRVEAGQASGDTFGVPESRRFRKRLRFKLAAAALVVVLGIAGYLVWRHYAGWESTDDAEVDAHIHAVSARLAGHVSKVYVDENQQVAAGTVLAEIDPADYQVALERARAELQNSQANATAAREALSITSANTASQLRSARAEIESNAAAFEASQRQAEAQQARIREAEANNTKAQTDLARYRQLVEKDEISRQQYDQAVVNAKAAAAGVDVARAGGSVARQQIAESRSRILQAQAGLQSAATAPEQVAVTRAKAGAAAADAEKFRAALDQAQLNLQYTKIVSPVNGLVGKKSVESGQNVQTGQEIMSIIPVDDVWITANFKETQLQKMRPGQEAQIHCESTGRDYRGKIDSIGAASGARFSLLPPENATGNYVKVVQRIPVKIVLNPGENSDHLLRPGMSVEPRIRVK